MSPFRILKGRIFLPFLLIVGLPLLALVWLGWRMSRNEQKLLETQYNELMKERLQVVAAEIYDFINETEKSLDPFLTMASNGNNEYGKDELRLMVRKSPLIIQAFKIDNRGKLIFPPPSSEDLSEGERRFIERTREIIEGGMLDTSPYETESKSTARASQSKWYSYHWNDGLHLIFYRSGGLGEVRGVEVSSIRLIAELIASLPPPNNKFSAARDQVLSLRDSEGKVIYQWGDVAVLANSPRVQEVSAPSPFQSWKLSIALNSGKLSAIGGASAFNFISGIALLCVLVLGLSFYVYREQKRELIEASQRVNFVNQVSHELKTPLTSIRMYADLLESRLNEQDQQARGFLAVISSESERLSRLIGNILTFASKENGKLAIKTRAINVANLLRDIIEQFRPSLDKSSLTVKSQISSDSERLADPDAICQIVGNLISNVEKYASKGKSLNISYLPKGEDLVIEVSDNGPGIDPNAKSKIFLPFFRGSDSITEGVSGTGIGLTIARELARRHGGDIILKPSIKGAHFEVTIRAPQVSKRLGS